MSTYFYIQSQLNQLVITIDGSKNGSNLVMYTANGEDNQLWKFGPGDSLVNKMGLVAGVDTWSIFSSPPFPCIAGTPNSIRTLKWQYENDEMKSTIVSLPFQEFNYAMDIAHSDTEVSAIVQMYEITGNPNQKWILVPEGKLQDS